MWAWFCAMLQATEKGSAPARAWFVGSRSSAGCVGTIACKQLWRSTGGGGANKWRGQPDAQDAIEAD